MFHLQGKRDKKKKFYYIVPQWLYTEFRNSVSWLRTSSTGCTNHHQVSKLDCNTLWQHLFTISPCAVWTCSMHAGSLGALRVSHWILTVCQLHRIKLSHKMHTQKQNFSNMRSNLQNQSIHIMKQKIFTQTSNTNFGALGKVFKIQYTVLWIFLK